MLGWTPDRFAAATVRDLFDAIAGYRERHGLDGDADRGVSEQQLAELVAAHGGPRRSLRSGSRADGDGR